MLLDGRPVAVSEEVVAPRALVEDRGAIEQRLGVPVRFAGVGERPEDLVDFDPVTFVAALFA